MPSITLQQLADGSAAEIAAEALRAGLDPPAVGAPTIGVVVAEAAGLRIVVTIARHEGPARLHLARGIDPAGYPGAIPAPPPPPTVAPHVLREIERCIMEAAPASPDKPVTMKRLIKLAGYKYTRHSLEAVHRLVEIGLLVQIKGGCRKTR